MNRVFITVKVMSAMIPSVTSQAWRIAGRATAKARQQADERKALVLSAKEEALVYSFRQLEIKVERLTGMIESLGLTRPAAAPTQVVEATAMATS